VAETYPKGWVCLDSDSWENKVANPEAFGDAEKQLWKQIEPLLHSVLDELKANGKIETIFIPVDMKALSAALEKLDEVSSACNSLGNMFDNKDQFKRLLGTTSQFNLDEPKLISMYITMQVTIAVLSTELFKILLLFHMKDVSHDVSKFLTTMQNAAPNNWPQLRPFVDNAFRNALAHGTYAMVHGRIVLFKDAKLEKSDEMELSEFMIRLKKQNVLYACLVNVLVAKKKSGFLVP